MSDMKWLKQALSQAAETSRWLKTEGPGLKAKADAQMAEKKAAAMTGSASNGGLPTIAANTPMGQQISQLKGMLQMLPDTHPQKAALAAQIAQLEAFSSAQVPTGSPQPALANPFQAAIQNPFALSLGAQSSIGGNPMQALMMQWLQGMMSQQQQQPPYR